MRHRRQLERAPNGQTWDNLSNENNIVPNYRPDIKYTLST